MLNTLKSRVSQINGRTWFSIQAKAEADHADVLIYDYIGWGGVTAVDFAKELQVLKAKTITVRLNTPGGDVFDGLAIHNSLKAHGAAIQVKVDGLAASIGSIIAMAGSTITMGESAFLMIHNPWALVIGNAKDMREMADTLDKIGGSLAGVYASRQNVTKDQAQAWMDAETWFTAEEAVAAGLADAVETQAAAENRAAFDLSGYANLPTALRLTKTESSAGAGVVDERSKQVAAINRKRLALVQRDERSR